MDVIAFRILVEDSTQRDFEDRLRQWKKVMNYIDTKINDKTKLVLLGDWNHAYIREHYVKGEYDQNHFNYQKIKCDLENRNLKMGIDVKPKHKEHSYKGYLAIDHIAVASSICYGSKKPYYSSNYGQFAPIGKPNHAFLVAEINVR